MESKNNIFKLLKKESPNIICFQEFYNDKSDKFVTLDPSRASNNILHLSTR